MNCRTPRARVSQDSGSEFHYTAGGYSLRQTKGGALCDD